MFRDYINNPIDPIPRAYVDLLSRLDGELDYSLTCLGIALLKPRIKDYKGIKGAIKSYVGKLTCVADLITEEKECNNEDPALYFYKYNTTDGQDDEMMKNLKDAGFLVKENVGTYIKTKTNIECIALYHKDKNIGAFIMNSMDIRIYHVLMSFISLLFPKLFEEMPLRKPVDYDIIVSLSKTDKSNFIQKIQTAVKPYIAEFRRLTLNNLLSGMHERKIESALNEVTNQRSYITSIEATYSDAIRKLRELIAFYEGMKVTEQTSDAENELVEYLSTNENIHNLNIVDGKLIFSVATLLNNWNESAWETFDKRGFIYDGCYGHTKILDVFNRDNRRILLNSIFSESPEFAVKIAGNYSIDIYNCYLSANRAYDYISADPIYKSYVPNPHLKLFSCLGGYKERVIKAVRAGDYITAVELCCASAGSVNLEETEQTFRPFIGWILSSREKILRRKDGVEMTPEEALVYLVDKEKEKNE